MIDAVNNLEQLFSSIKKIAAEQQLQPIQKRVSAFY